MEKERTIHNPPEAHDSFTRGLEKLNSGQWKEALDHFTEAIRLRPDVSLGWRYRSYAHADGGNFVRAIADLDEAIRLKPDDVQAYYDRAQHLLRQKQFDLALGDCNKAIELDPARADLLGLRGRIYSENGSSEHALADFAKALQMDPEGAKDYLVWRGNLYMELDQYEEALESFTAAIERNGEDPELWGSRALCSWLMDDTDSALQDMNKAISLNAEIPYMRFRRGAILQQREAYDEALLDFSAAIEKNPNYIAAYESRAEIQYKLGKRQEAMNDLAEALRHHPDPGQTLRLLNRRAMYHYFNKDYLKAIKDHTDALKKDPNHAATFNYLAWIWCTSPDPNVRNGRRALECATRANELSEWQNPAFLDTLAAAHAELGQFTEALNFQGKAMELADNPVSEAEYTKRMELYENHEPLRVQPREGV